VACLCVEGREESKLKSKKRSCCLIVFDLRLTMKMLSGMLS
jgi:hypothetical protein